MSHMQTSRARYARRADEQMNNPNKRHSVARPMCMNSAGRPPPTARPTWAVNNPQMWASQGATRLTHFTSPGFYKVSSVSRPYQIHAETMVETMVGYAGLRTGDETKTRHIHTSLNTRTAGLVDALEF